MATIDIPISDETSAELFTKSYEISAVAQLANFEQLLSPVDQIRYSFNASHAGFHSPEDPNPKQESNDKLKSVRVPVETMYKMDTFHDKHYDSRVGKKIVDRIEQIYPQIMAESLDRLPFGPDAIDDNPFGGLTETPFEVDETAASWLGAIATLEAKKMKPSGFLLDNAYKPAIRKAFTEGSLTNPLSFGVQDGFSIAGIPVYFRDLGEDATGNPHGTVADWSYSVLVSYDAFETPEIHLPGGDWGLRKLNRVGLYIGWRLGFGVVDQKAFLPLTLGAAVTA